MGYEEIWGTDFSVEAFISWSCLKRGKIKRSCGRINFFQTILTSLGYKLNLKYHQLFEFWIMIFNLGSICLSNFERLPAKEIVVIRGLFL